MNTLEDRVKLLQKLVLYGAQAFDRSSPPSGSIRDPEMRRIGLAVTEVCKARDDRCELMAIYDFVKRNVRYTGDVTNKDTFQSAWVTMQNAGGDCFPEGTLFVTRDGFKAVEEIQIGDEVHDGTMWVPVLKTWSRGLKTIVRARLDNGNLLRLSEQHKVLRGNSTEMRMMDVRPGDHLLQPYEAVDEGDAVTKLIRTGCPLLARAAAIARKQAVRPRLAWDTLEVRPRTSSHVRVASIEPDEAAQMPSYDIMTSSGRVYLPEADVITRQCDDHAVLSAVLAMVNGFTPKFRITSNYGASWDHIYCIVGVPKLEPRSFIALDTTLPGSTDARFGKEPPRAKFRDFGMGDT